MNQYVIFGDIVSMEVFYFKVVLRFRLCQVFFLYLLYLYLASVRKRQFIFFR